MNDAIIVGEARPDDARAIGAIPVASWRETYAGIVPQHFLDGLSADDRSAMWNVVLNDPAAWAGAAVFVAEAESGIIGFGACGGQRDAALKAQGFDGEIGAIYVLRSHQRVGVGRSLMRVLGQRLVARDRRAAALWVLRENSPARNFYERLGGTIVGEREEEQSDVTLAEVAYGWNDLTWLQR